MGRSRLVIRFALFPVEPDDEPLPGVWIRYGETLGRLAVEPNPGPVYRADWLIFDPCSGAAGRAFPFWIYSGTVAELPRARGRKIVGVIGVVPGLRAGRPLPGFGIASLCSELPTVDEAELELLEEFGP